MTYSKASGRAVGKYIKKSYDRIDVKVPKGCKKLIEAHAEEHGESVNALINRAIRAEIGVSERDWKKQIQESEDS